MFCCFLRPTHKRCVLINRECLSVNEPLTIRRLWLDVALAEQVIQVDAADLRVKGIHPVPALLREQARIEVIIRQVAILIHVHVQLIIDQPVPVGHLELHGFAVNQVICHWVAHHETLQFRLIASGLSLNVVIDLFNKFGHVDPSVGLPRDVKVVALKLWEFLFH